MSTTNSLRAGAAMVDVTPTMGTHLSGSGMGQHRPARTVLDPLYAKALVVDDGDRRLCIVTLDATILSEPHTTRIRQEIGDRLDIAADAILVHAIQTHSAPSVGHFMLDPDFPLATTPATEYLRGAENAYADVAVAGAVDAAVQAAARLRPAHLGSGHGIADRLAFNRRVLDYDGRCVMPFPQGSRRHPLGPNHLCWVEGPADPTVGVLAIQDDDMRMIALLLHFTCHPVNVFCQPGSWLAVSADWPGAWSRDLIAAYGPDTVPLVLNGCCGNINPMDPWDPDFQLDHDRMGRRLAAVTRRVVAGMDFADPPALAAARDHVELDYRDIPEPRRREVEEILAAHREPPRGDDGEVDPRWFLAASTRSVDLARQRDGRFAYEVQTLRLGRTAVVGLPGEPFVEGQLRLRVASPFAETFVAHLTTHYVGYLPTREAYAHGGHEANADVTYWAKLAPGSLEAVVDRAAAMLAGLASNGQ